METYWQEVNLIVEEDGEEGGEEGRGEGGGEGTLYEVGMEEAWLMEAGLSSLMTNGLSPSEEAEPPLVDALLSTLSRQQAATVKMKLDQYKETLRRSNRPPIRDVRDIFTEVTHTQTPAQLLQFSLSQPDDDSAKTASVPPADSGTSSPSQYHTTTKTIRRQSHTVRPTLQMFEDKLPELPSTPGSKPSPGTSSADWLLKNFPYSESVSEHKVGGTCWDCLRFHGEQQLAPPPPGFTCVDDLSSCDLTRISFISHIELSTLLAALRVQTKRCRPRRRRTTDGAVFGVPLNSLLANDRKMFPATKVPIVFHKLLCILEQSGLQTEGIFRVSASAARIKYLRRELDSRRAFDWSAVRTVEAASLLKLFIRELPTPLLTNTHTSVLGISSEVHQLQALQLLTVLLPEAHRHTLRALLLLLRQVVSNQDKNRMSLWNISMVMAPNLFSSCCHSNNTALEEAMGGANLVRLMVLHQDWLFMVPAFLLSQVRQMNQVSNQKQFGLSRVKRLLRRTEHSQVTELCDGVIRVHAPQHTKVSMAIQLDEMTTARDVTSRFESDDSSALRLYEVGGNICERRLHPNCSLLNVYRVNPHCDWLVKP